MLVLCLEVVLFVFTADAVFLVDVFVFFVFFVDVFVFFVVVVVVAVVVVVVVDVAADGSECVVLNLLIEFVSFCFLSLFDDVVKILFVSDGAVSVADDVKSDDVIFFDVANFSDVVFVSVSPSGRATSSLFVKLPNQKARHCCCCCENRSTKSNVVWNPTR